MVTVVISTTNRPHMLRTALRSVNDQTAKAKIGRVIVSENAGNRSSGDVCNEFPSLPIKYIFRDPPIPALMHGIALFTEAASLTQEYTAILHDDDWWSPHHLANGLAQLGRHQDVSAYWSTSYLVHGESSWLIQCWNESCWIASGFAPLTDVAKLDSKQAALACVGSGPAHYSSLIAEKHALAENFQVVAKTGNLHDNDRLLFLEFARHGPLLVNFIPEVFVRQHPAQDQRSLSYAESSKHISAATDIVLEFCREQGLDVLEEFARLDRECPIPAYRPYLTGTFDPRIRVDLHQRNLLPPVVSLEEPRNSKWLAKKITPPLVWSAMREVKMVLSRSGR